MQAKNDRMCLVKSSTPATMKATVYPNQIRNISQSKERSWVFMWFRGKLLPLCSHPFSFLPNTGASSSSSAGVNKRGHTIGSKHPVMPPRSGLNASTAVTQAIGRLVNNKEVRRLFISQYRKRHLILCDY